MTINSTATAVPVGGDTKESMRKSTTTTTTVEKDGTTKVTVEEISPDGSRNVKMMSYPPGVTPPATGGGKYAVKV